MAPSLPQIRVSDIDLLTDWDLSQNVKAFSDSIPGYRSSATFLTTLRSNLHLSASDLSPSNSLVSTPTTPAFSCTASLPHPTPNPFSISTTYPSYDAPEEDPELAPILTTSVARPEHNLERDAALRLIASSVSEQRLSTVKAVALNQVTIAALILLTGILRKYCSVRTICIITTILTLVTPATLYYLTLPYTALAASINITWLDTSRKSSNGKCEDPIILVSRWGEEVIGALVLRVVKRERKGYVRAWAVESSYRRKGVGSGLLEEAVRVAWGKGARSVIFEEEHAHSHRVLQESFNGCFDDQEAKARLLLAVTVANIRREKSSR